MTFHYNVTGEDRKRLVYTMGEILGCRPKYLLAPTYAYEVDIYTVSKNGDVTFDDRADSEEVERLVESLAEKGFVPEATEEEEHMEEQHGENITTEQSDTLTIILPRKDFTDASLDNLCRLAASKETLLRKALGREDKLAVIAEPERVLFPWFSLPASEDETKAYTHLVTALCDMAKTQKRVTAKEKHTDNEKYAFRCFLLRLGFIGSEYKSERKILLRNLEGSSAFRNGAKKADGEPQVCPTSGAESEAAE